MRAFQAIPEGGSRIAVYGLDVRLFVAIAWVQSMGCPDKHNAQPNQDRKAATDHPAPDSKIHWPAEYHPLCYPEQKQLSDFYAYSVYPIAAGCWLHHCIPLKAQLFRAQVKSHGLEAFFHKYT